MNDIDNRILTRRKVSYKTDHQGRMDIVFTNLEPRTRFVVTVENEVVDDRIEPLPLGLLPKMFHDEHRLQAIRSAITRYVNSNLPIPPEWISELNELIEKGVKIHERNQ